MNGKVEIEYQYLNATYPDNHPLIYTDEEIDNYFSVNFGKSEKTDSRARPTLVRLRHAGPVGLPCHAKYPIRGKSVVNMGSMTPWYESMFILFGASPVTIEYNSIIVRSDRMRVMTIDEWEKERPTFDVGFSISSFEHDGLGMYGDPSIRMEISGRCAR